MTRHEDRGATAVEYGLMVAAIAAVIVGLVFGIGNVLRDMYGETSACLAAGDAAAAPCLVNNP